MSAKINNLNLQYEHLNYSFVLLLPVFIELRNMISVKTALYSKDKINSNTFINKNDAFIIYINKSIPNYKVINNYIFGNKYFKYKIDSYDINGIDSSIYYFEHKDIIWYMDQFKTGRYSKFNDTYKKEIIDKSDSAIKHILIDCMEMKENDIKYISDIYNVDREYVIECLGIEEEHRLTDYNKFSFLLDRVYK